MTKTLAQFSIWLHERPLASNLADKKIRKFISRRLNEDVYKRQPGYKADICVFNNLVNFQPQLVLKNGVVIVNKQKLLWQSPPLLKDPENTMHLEDVREQQLRLPVMNGRKARVIRIVPEQILTETEYVQPKAEAGFIVSDTAVSYTHLDVYKRQPSAADGK